MVSIKRVYIIITTLIYSLFILYFALLPVDSLPEVNIPFIDKIVHFIEYFLLSILLCFCFKNKPNQIKSALILSIVYGIMIELFQGLTATRNFEYYDIFANVLGVILGVILFKAKLYKTIEIL